MSFGQPTIDRHNTCLKRRLIPQLLDKSLLDCVDKMLVGQMSFDEKAWRHLSNNEISELNFSPAVQVSQTHHILALLSQT
jgi:hypothetical protein